MLRQACRKNIKALLLNGRLSERSLKHYHWVPGLIRETLQNFVGLATISNADADRFIALGAPRDKVMVTGNAKYDLTAVTHGSDPGAGYRQALQLPPASLVWVAGSTHTGEEAVLAEVYLKLKQQLPALVWVVAPRHLRRLPEIEALFRARGIDFDRRSELVNRERVHDVVLVDTMGELAGLYAAADYIFCGGSLVERGGHNVYEAAVWGRPVIYGPSMKDFADAKALLEETGGGFPVANPAEIGHLILAWARAPERYAVAAEKARVAVLAQQGAAKRQAALVKQLVAGRAASM
jgi:3-deoxy-D-manno-octulosonic-acid transferase